MTVSRGYISSTKIFAFDFALYNRGSSILLNREPIKIRILNSSTIAARSTEPRKAWKKGVFRSARAEFARGRREY